MKVTAVDRATGTIPLVSVVMPVHNGERYLEEAISSVLSQTLHEIELLVVVNGSTDASYEIAQRFSVADQRVSVIQLPEAGVGPALNRGIKGAQAKWIARMDADDIALPERLERQLAFLERNSSVAAVGSFGWMIGATGRRMGISRVGPITREAFLERRRRHKAIFLLSSSVVFSRDIARAIGGFRQGYAPAEDVDLWTRIADDHDILVIPKPLVSYRIHGGSASAQGLHIQMRNARLINENSKRRRSGQRELSPEEFEQIERRHHWWRRLNRWRETQSLHYYRRGGTRLGIGSKTGFLWLFVSLILAPLVPMRRFVRQRAIQVAVSRIVTSGRQAIPDERESE